MADETSDSIKLPASVLDYFPAKRQLSPKPWFLFCALSIGCMVLSGAIWTTGGPNRIGKGVSLRIQCAAHEHQLLNSALDYAASHSGALPKSIQASDLGQSSAMFKKIDHCPEGVGAYVYLGAGQRFGPQSSEVIILYEPPTNHKDPRSGKGTMNVAYASGKVESIAQPQADKIIAELNAGHNPPRPEMIN